MKIICPSTTLSLGLLLSLAHPADGQNWTLTSAPTNAWYSVTCSADGSRIAAAANPGPIYLSADGGATWAPAQSAPSNTWYSIACSASGTNLIAAGGGAVYTSVDAGISWRSNQVNWSATASTALISASSPDGTVLLAGGQAIGLFTSTNAGVTWNSNKVVFPNSRWLSAICAEHGARLYAVQEGGLGMWASTNPDIS